MKMSKAKYCPYCGYVFSEIELMMKSVQGVCLGCSSKTTPTETLHDVDYYQEIAKSKFPGKEIYRGNYGAFRWREIVEEEAAQNPLFNKELYQRRITKEVESAKVGMKNTNIFIEEKIKNMNVPKCPTCGSPKIKTISIARKAAGAWAFGILSRTARSQFQCQNCGYKW
jgi:DNA-directed RNA polymerase subunit RPC12/RpoP